MNQDQEMNRLRYLGVEFQGGRVFYTFRRSVFYTPEAEDTPRYYPQGPPSTVVVQKPYTTALIVRRNLEAEFNNE